MPPAPHLRIVPLPADEPGEEPLDFAEIFRDHARYVATVALRVLGRDDEVDDVVQDVFLAALSDLRRLQRREALRGWLATVTVRCASRRLRRRRLRLLLGLDRAADADRLVCPGASPEQRALLARIYALLDRIPVAERVAWTLRCMEGEPVETVAGLCGCSLATAKRRIAAAQRSLERMLADVDP